MNKVRDFFRTTGNFLKIFIFEMKTNSLSTSAASSRSVHDRRSPAVFRRFIFDLLRGSDLFGVSDLIRTFGLFRFFDLLRRFDLFRFFDLI